MSFEPSYKGLEREELRFTSELGWLASASLVIILIAI